MTYVGSATPPTELGFGMVCKADWLFDVVIHSNSTTLIRKDDFPKKKALEVYGRPDVHYYMPEPHGKDEEDFAVLGFGTSYPAYIVLTDDCALEKCQGRGGEPPTGRVTLAPLAYRTKDDPKDLATIGTLNRFPLPKDATYGTDHIVSLGHAFQVDSRHIWTDAHQLQPGFELLRQLDHETKDDLLQRWAAHTTRQGPMIATHNARKLADIITAVAGDGSAQDVADRVTELALAIWDYENGPLEVISSAHEEWLRSFQPPDLTRLKDGLLASLDSVGNAVRELVQQLGAL